MEEGRGGPLAAPWPAARRRKGENFRRKRNEERESVELPNEDFLPFLILYTLTSYNEIMPSAPLKLLLYISTLPLKVRLLPPSLCICTPQVW